MQRSADTYRPSYSVYDGWRSPPSPDRFIPRRSISPGFSRPFEEDDRRYEPGHRRSFAERIEPDSYRPDEHLHEDPGLRLLRRMDVGQRGRDAYDSRDRELSPPRSYSGSRPRAGTWLPPRSRSRSPARPPIRFAPRSPPRGRSPYRDLSPPPPFRSMKRRRSVTPPPQRSRPPARLRHALPPPPPPPRSRSRTPPRPLPRNLRDRISPGGVLAKRIRLSSSPKGGERRSQAPGVPSVPEKRGKTEHPQVVSPRPDNRKTATPILDTSATPKPGLPPAEAILGWSAKHIEKTSSVTKASRRRTLAEESACICEACSMLPSRANFQSEGGHGRAAATPETTSTSAMPVEPSSAPPPLPEPDLRLKLPAQKHCPAKISFNELANPGASGSDYNVLDAQASESVRVDCHPQASGNDERHVVELEPGEIASAPEEVRPNKQVVRKDKPAKTASIPSLTAQKHVNKPQFKKSNANLQGVKKSVAIKEHNSLSRQVAKKFIHSEKTSSAASETSKQRPTRIAASKSIPSQAAGRYVRSDLGKSGQGTNNGAVPQNNSRRPSVSQTRHRSPETNIVESFKQRPQQQSSSCDMEDSFADMYLPTAFSMFGDVLPDVVPELLTAQHFLEPGLAMFAQEQMFRMPFPPIPMGMPMGMPGPIGMHIPFFAASAPQGFVNGQVPPQFPQQVYQPQFMPHLGPNHEQQQHQSQESFVNQPHEDSETFVQQHEKQDVAHGQGTQGQNESDDEVLELEYPCDSMEEFAEAVLVEAKSAEPTLPAKPCPEKKKRKKCKKTHMKHKDRIGREFDESCPESRGRFNFQSHRLLLSGPSRCVPDAARTLIMEDLPRDCCKLQFVRDWQCQYDNLYCDSDTRVIIDLESRKVLVEFSTVDSARRAFMGNRFSNKRKGILVWYYRPHDDDERALREMVGTLESEEQVDISSGLRDDGNEHEPAVEESVKTRNAVSSQESEQISSGQTENGPLLSTEAVPSAVSDNTAIAVSSTMTSMDISVVSVESVTSDLTLSSHTDYPLGTSSAQTTPTPESAGPCTPFDSPPDLDQMADALLSDVLCSVRGRAIIPGATTSSSTIQPGRPKVRNNSLILAATAPNSSTKSASKALLTKQQRLERHIAESKVLMARLSNAKSKAEKERILALLREKNRLFDEANNETPPRPPLTKRPTIFRSQGVCWPETSRDNVDFVLSDSESECEAYDDVDN